MLDFSIVREITAAFFEFGIVIHLFVVLSDVRFLRFQCRLRLLSFVS